MRMVQASGTLGKVYKKNEGEEGSEPSTSPSVAAVGAGSVIGTVAGSLAALFSDHRGLLSGPYLLLPSGAPHAPVLLIVDTISLWPCHCFVNSLQSGYMEKQRKVAVFDIDGTIFRSSLLLELVEALIHAKVFSKYAKSHYEESWEKWRDREGSYYDFIMSVVSAYKGYIKGVRRAEVWKVAERVIDMQKKRTYRYTRDLVKKLQKTHYLLAISHSPYEVVAPFAKTLGFEKVYAQVYEVDKKVRFTGNWLYQDILPFKNKVLERAIEHNNLTLKGSVGVGDTESDIPFLEMVDQPIAFNPSSELYKMAKKKKWDILVERKDVIYHL